MRSLWNAASVEQQRGRPRRSVVWVGAAGGTAAEREIGKEVGLVAVAAAAVLERAH